MTEASGALAGAGASDVALFLDAGPGPARVLVYGGVRPTLGSPAAGDPLATIALELPSGVVDSGVLTLASPESVMVAADGVPTWARVVNGAGALAWDCDVPGDLQSPGALYAGGNLRIVSGAVSTPGGVVTFEAVAQYSVDVSRPTVARAGGVWQAALPAGAGAEHRTSGVAPVETGVAAPHASAARALAGAGVRSQGSERSHTRRVSLHQNAARVATWPTRAQHGDGLRDARRATVGSFQTGEGRRAQAVTGWQERYRDRRPALMLQYAEALFAPAPRTSSFQKARPVLVRHGARHQEAMRPPPGMRPRPVPPPEPGCYDPDPNLMFRWPAATDGALFFRCDYRAEELPAATTVVPIRSVYVVNNNVSLRRVDGNVPIPAFSVSLSIDAESWTWAFSASIPAAAIGDVAPDANGPAELEVEVNGNPYRVLAERIVREREFGSARVRVSGRGKSALLASPYAPVLTFTNAIDRTAQQLMADVLTVNGVPLGWSVAWGLDDWLVPAGAFNVRGAYVEGLSAIAGAAGAYLQPHPTLQEVRVLPRYPTAPWAWGTVAPDFELPSAVVARDSIEWFDRPQYNRVYVGGTSQGVLGRVTRAGTAGDFAAPTVIDPLITAAAAARQRGVAILGDTGRQARVGLRLPVLPATGVIHPGKFVRYNDGGVMRMGIVRSTAVEAGFPEVWQSIEVETHS